MGRLEHCWEMENRIGWRVWRMICGEPVHRRPLLTFCPGTFSAVCLSCGRTLLVLLAVLPAVLRSVFAAFTIALLVSLLTVTAKGQGVTATLPETMTEDSVIDFVTEQEISTVEAFIQALPPCTSDTSLPSMTRRAPLRTLFPRVIQESSPGVPMLALS